MVIETGAVPIFIKLLNSEHEDVQEQVTSATNTLIWFRSNVKLWLSVNFLSLSLVHRVLLNGLIEAGIVVKASHP